MPNKKRFARNNQHPQNNTSMNNYGGPSYSFNLQRELNFRGNENAMGGNAITPHQSPFNDDNKFFTRRPNKSRNQNFNRSSLMSMQRSQQYDDRMDDDYSGNRGPMNAQRPYDAFSNNRYPEPFAHNIRDEQRFFDQANSLNSMRGRDDMDRNYSQLMNMNSNYKPPTKRARFDHGFNDQYMHPNENPQQYPPNPWFDSNPRLHNQQNGNRNNKPRANTRNQTQAPPRPNRRQLKAKRFKVGGKPKAGNAAPRTEERPKYLHLKMGIYTKYPLTNSEMEGERAQRVIEYFNTLQTIMLSQFTRTRSKRKLTHRIDQLHTYFVKAAETELAALNERKTESDYEDRRKALLNRLYSYNKYLEAIHYIGLAKVSELVIPFAPKEEQSYANDHEKYESCRNHEMQLQIQRLQNQFRQRIQQEIQSAPNVSPKTFVVETKPSPPKPTTISADTVKEEETTAEVEAAPATVNIKVEPAENTPQPSTVEPAPTTPTPNTNATTATVTTTPTPNPSLTPTSNNKSKSKLRKDRKQKLLQNQTAGPNKNGSPPQQRLNAAQRRQLAKLNSVFNSSKKYLTMLKAMKRNKPNRAVKVANSANGTPVKNENEIKTESPTTTIDITDTDVAAADVATATTTSPTATDNSNNSATPLIQSAEVSVIVVDTDSEISKDESATGENITSSAPNTASADVSVVVVDNVAPSVKDKVANITSSVEIDLTSAEDTQIKC